LKFPVPLRREFGEKALVEPALFGVRRKQGIYCLFVSFGISERPANRSIGGEAVAERHPSQDFARRNRPVA
jgi:hypothetical protein